MHYKLKGFESAVVRTVVETYSVDEDTRVLKLVKEVDLYKYDGKTPFIGSHKNMNTLYMQKSRMVCNGSVVVWIGKNF